LSISVPIPSANLDATFSSKERLDCAISKDVNVTLFSVYLLMIRFSTVIAKSEAVITPPGPVPTSAFVKSPAPVILEAVNVNVGSVCTLTVSPAFLISHS
jgi:hypothetical protein